MPDEHSPRLKEDGAGSRNYEIGYGKPPANRRFQKGRSGNRKGRPRGTQNLDTLLGMELTERIPIKENGRSRTVTKLVAILKQQVNKALTGDRAAAKFVFEQLRQNKQSSALFPIGPDGRPQIPFDVVQAVVDSLMLDADEAEKKEVEES
jgi:hypothetical protein